MKFWGKFIVWQFADRKTASFFGVYFLRLPVLLFWCWLFIWTPMTWYHLYNCDYTLHYTSHDFNLNQKDTRHSQAIAAWGDSYISKGEKIPRWFGMEMGGTPRIGGLIDAREYCWTAFGFTEIRHYKLRHDLIPKIALPRQIDKSIGNVLKLSGVSFIGMVGTIPIVAIGMAVYPFWHFINS